MKGFTAGMAKDIFFTIRMNEDEKAALQQKAEEHQMTLSEYMLSACLKFRLHELLGESTNLGSGKKEISYNLRLTEKERELLREKAARYHMTVSGYITYASLYYELYEKLEELLGAETQPTKGKGKAKGK